MDNSNKPERVISATDSAICRIQALQEQSLRLQVEMYAFLAKKDFQEIYDRVWKEVDSSTKELIQLYSHLQGDSDISNN